MTEQPEPAPPRPVPAKVQDAVDELEAMSGVNYKTDHYRADDILLSLVHPLVRAAYLRLSRERARRWHPA